MHLQYNIHLKQQKYNIFYCNIETQNTMSVSYWGSCRFHIQRPHCESSKYISAHLCAHGGDGPKVTYWQVQCWRIAILRQEEKRQGRTSGTKMERGVTVPSGYSQVMVEEI